MNFPKENNPSFEGEISELIHEQLLFTESIYARIPLGVEVYDSTGILRSINDYALGMYGVYDRATVVNKVDLFKSPYVDDELKSRIQKGENITLEFEYDFDRINRVAYFKSYHRAAMIYQVKVVAIRNKKGIIIGHMLLTNDVTAVKEAEFRTEEAKKNLEMAMDTASMSSWVYEVEKDRFHTLYGKTVSKDNMTMDGVMLQLHPQDRMLLKQLLSQLINKELSQGQLTLRFYNEAEQQYRYYESRMRLSSEHRGKLLVVGTEMDVTDKVRLAKKTQNLLAKRELAMKVSSIVHWDFDVETRKFKAYNDPVNDYESDKLIAVPEYLDVIHPEDRAAFHNFIHAMSEGKNSTTNFSCRLQTKYDNTWQYCDFISVPFEWNEKGEVIRFTGFRQNIPQLQKLNRELKDRNSKIELSFKTVGMSYWDYDVDEQEFRAFNNPVTGYHSEQKMTIDDYLEVTHPDDVESVVKNFHQMDEGIKSDFSFKYRSKTKWEDEWKILQVTGIPVECNKDGRCIRYTGLTVNVTKKEKMIEDLMVLKEKAELSDRLKTAFLANMSHEIRTPLNAIVGFSELLLSSNDDEEKKEFVNIIQSNNELLLRLIDDIIDLSKIESGIIDRKKERFNLSDVAHELYKIMQPKVSNRDIEFLQELPAQECWVWLDKSQLKQVWTNFLTNAIKFTWAGHIKMGYVIENEGIRIYVEDTGIGIPEKLQDQIFNRFQKVDDFVQGAGLGLAISKAITEAAGGKIGYTSVVGKGSTFWAWFPCTSEL